jgi:gliding motility-associated-like protein
MKKAIYLILLICCSDLVLGQTITPQVINSAGDHRQVGTSNIWITDNVGEPFTETISNNNFLITQGFIQPDIISKAGFTLVPTIQDFLCADKEEGSFVYLKINSTAAKYNVQGYFWTPSGVCPNNDCDTLRDIAALDYTVTIPVTYTANGVQKVDTIRSPIKVRNSSTPCLIHIFSGVTPNSDGINDVFTIENIQDFPKNRVTIYTRWGKQLCDIKGYNDKDPAKSWPSKDQASNLVPSTYFYIIELGNNTQPIKGWVELIKEE